MRFFGDSIAIAYGAEGAVSKAKDGKETKHCLIWTDTWLKRAGKWQIVAAQDTNIPCSPYASAFGYRLIVTAGE